MEKLFSFSVFEIDIPFQKHLVIHIFYLTLHFDNLNKRMTKQMHSSLSCIFRGILLFLVVVFTGITQSQNTFIDGTGIGIGGKTVRLIVYADRISFLEQDTALSIVPDKDSTFHFSIVLSEPAEAILRIEMYDYHFIMEPEKHYEIHIDSFPYSMDGENQNPMLFDYPLPAHIICRDSNDLNQKLYRFNNAIDSFSYVHEVELFVHRNKLYIDSLNKLAAEYYNEQDSGYFETYARSHVAALEYVCRPQINSKKIKRLLSFYPVPYNNLGYMELFNLYYSQYFTLGKGPLTKNHFRYWVHNNMYYEMMDSLGLDPMLRNEVIREMAFLKGMSEAFYDDDYNSEAILRCIARLRDETKFSEHRQIAENLITKLRKKRMAGSEAPDFCLADADNQQHCLSDYFGKPIYLSFVKLKERASLLELETMRHFYPKRKNDCVFITVVCDREFATMYNFLKNSKVGSRYLWNFVHLNNNYKLLETYGALTFPFFVSIDANGKVVASPARDPKEGGYNF